MAPTHSSKLQKKIKKVKVKTKRKLFQYHNEVLQAALLEIRENKMAVRQASRTFGVPKSTIQDRLLEKNPEKQGKTGPEPLLSVIGENKIADWFINLAKCGFPVKKSDLIETVEKILKDRGKKDLFKNGRPGQRWYVNFLKRHPQISLMEKPKALIKLEQWLLRRALGYGFSTWKNI
ncbi:hypothetical protein NQ314_012184 [Rhamnusium bicolor]|uniref:HTH CENPB-type domain-containing protein n=1 Tax=Rhamnusium bicolor TaxID=1586634 RepID=A0AAV8XCI4_9CUCU|nr:hypothetical protein NQ314_012184 [Rhamnusium bicolor]